MKSFINTFTLLYDALSKDIIATYPSLCDDIAKDLTRLSRALNHEGLGFITITHGEMEKAFLQGLSQKKRLGLDTGLVRGFGSKSNVDARPAYMHGLLQRVFSAEGTLLDDPDPTAIFFLRQWFSMAKKIELPCTPDRIDDALREWVAIDRSLPDHREETWDHDDPKWTRRQGHPLYGDVSVEYDLFSSYDDETPTWDLGSHWNLLSNLFGSIVGSLGIFDPWALRPKHGPGATADQKDGLKYDFPNWPAKLQSIFPWDFFASADLGLYKRESGTEPREREVPCVMYAVPKTQSEPRLIAAEPIAHQWIQGGIQRWFEEQVVYTPLRRCINFRDQSESQRLALEGSRDRLIATVDLSAASDRLSSRLVEYAFQSNPALLDALHACRSRLTRLPNGEVHRMRKFAPMGSAVCFPVQTIVFTGLALFSIMLTRGGSVRDAMESYTHEVQVFGDDIILPIDSYPVLCKLLTSLRLKVNENKSFASGFFREACGMDAFNGVDVTPTRVKRIYSKSDPSALQATVEASNNLFRKGLWNTSAALLKTIPIAERKLLAVGGQAGGAVSLYSFCGALHTNLRWNGDTHQFERRTIGVLSKNTMDRSDGDAGLVQFFSEEPNPDTHYESGQPGKSKLRKKVGYYPLS
jgi:hypothetical protein